MPIKSESVDALVCDIPFGRIHSTPEEIQNSYPLLLSEFHRVIKPSSRLVLLTSEHDLLLKTINKFNNDNNADAGENDNTNPTKRIKLDNNEASNNDKKIEKIKILETLEVKLGSLQAAIFVLEKC